MKTFTNIAASALLALSLSACALNFDETPLNGREIVEPGSKQEKGLDRYLGDVAGEAWICPDGKRVRYVSGGWITHTCAPDRP